MKFVIIGPVYPYKGGIAHFTTALAKALRDNRVEAEVISFKRQYPKFLYPSKSDIDPSKKKFLVDARYLIDSIYPISWYKTLEYIVNFTPKLVIFQWWTTYWAPLTFYLTRSLSKKKIKTLCIVHNTYPHETKFYDRIITKISLSNVDTFLALSSSESSKLQDLFPNAKIILHYLPLYKLFSSVKDKQKEKIRYKDMMGIPRDNLVLLFFGTIRQYKGLENTIKAMKILKESLPNFTLIIAGEFWNDKEKYRNMIGSLNLQTNILIDDRYVPNEEVEQYFIASDIFIAPYEKGTQSGAVTIAASFDLPIITTPQIAEGLKAYKYSSTFIIPVNDPELIVQQILKISSKTIDPPASQEFALQFDWNSLAKLIVDEVN